MRKDNLAKERIGQINNNNQGSLMEVVEYNRTKDVWVKFIDTGNLAHTTWIDFQNGRVKNVYDKTVFGVGYLGEGKYKSTINGKHTPQYLSWVRMLTRCYDGNFHKRQPKYRDCEVCEEWLNYQNFAKWHDENYYEINEEEMHLDKDILVKGNKLYSPEKCIFVPHRINALFVKGYKRRGELPLGVSRDPRVDNRYRISVKDGKNFNTSFGGFTTPLDAFMKYKEIKEEIIKSVAKEYEMKIPKKLYEAMISHKIEIDD
ncbi:hypothetical protein [Metabacillus sp. Hm71]|uniref:hypothetical protein n=1 Tax=Metabacillus sp. Hm71 TaxID=3450743 RepID=UPI003F4431C3